MDWKKELVHGPVGQNIKERFAQTFASVNSVSEVPRPSEGLTHKKIITCKRLNSTSTVSPFPQELPAEVGQINPFSITQIGEIPPEKQCKSTKCTSKPSKLSLSKRCLSKTQTSGSSLALNAEADDGVLKSKRRSSSILACQTSKDIKKGNFDTDAGEVQTSRIAAPESCVILPNGPDGKVLRRDLLLNTSPQKRCSSSARLIGKGNHQSLTKQTLPGKPQMSDLKVAGISSSASFDTDPVIIIDCDDEEDKLESDNCPVEKIQTVSDGKILALEESETPECRSLSLEGIDPKNLRKICDTPDVSMKGCQRSESEAECDKITDVQNTLNIDYEASCEANNLIHIKKVAEIEKYDAAADAEENNDSDTASNCSGFLLRPARNRTGQKVLKNVKRQQKRKSSPLTVKHDGRKGTQKPTKRCKSLNPGQKTTPKSSSRQGTPGRKERGHKKKRGLTKGTVLGNKSLTATSENKKRSKSRTLQRKKSNTQKTTASGVKNLATKGDAVERPSMFGLSELEHATNCVLPLSELVNIQQRLNQPNSVGSFFKAKSSKFSSLLQQTHVGGVWRSIVEED